MLKRLTSFFALAAIAFAGDPLGDWYGTLDTGAAQLRIVFHLTKAPDAAVKATLDSLDQGAMAIPATSATVNADKVVLEWSNISGKLEATVNEAGTELNGTWSQGGGSLPLKLTRTKFEIKEGQPVPLSASERDFLISHFEQSRREFFKSIEGLKPEQWTYKPASGGWSIAECAEHLVTSEEFIFNHVKNRVLSMPVRGDVTRKTKADDEQIIARFTDRTQKGQAPEPLKPTGNLTTPEAAKNTFNERRDRNIQFVRTTQEDMRGRRMGQMDAYQFLVMMSAHTLRHTAQLNEVKADAKYPK